MIASEIIKIIACLTLAIALSVNSSAYSYGISVRNAYSFEPVQGAETSFYASNDSLIDTEISDSEGLIAFEPPFYDDYFISIEKTGYNPFEYIVYVNESTPDKIAYMTYSSIEVSRLRFSDKTLAGIMPICLYYADNGRFKGCYSTNDTIILSAGNYTLYPRETAISYLTTLPGILTIVGLLIPAFLFAGIVLIIALVLVIILIRRK